MASKGLRTRVLTGLALASFGYAAVITFLNVQHNRAMPSEKRVLLESLDDLAYSVAVIESMAAGSTVQSNLGESLQRRDVRVLYGDRAFPVSRNVWVNTGLPKNDPDRYLHRFRVGQLSFEEQVNSNGEPLRRSFLIEVHQNFSEQGDQPRANLWLFPSLDTTDAAFNRPEAVDYAHNILIEKALLDPKWRALFSDNHTRLVRAFPALAAFLIGLAALGSLILKLWQEQSWAVSATTATFVLPIVSAAPFLTAFGWVPVIAAAVLGFIITVGIACAVEQRALPVLRDRVKASTPRNIAEAILISSVALIVGTSLVVSFASVSVIEWQGLGSASPGEIFMESLIRPAIGLLLGGVSSSLILALFYLLLGLRNRARTKSALS